MARNLLIIIPMLCAEEAVLAGPSDDIWSQWKLLDQEQNAWIERQIATDPTRWSPLDPGPHGQELIDLEGRLEELANKGDIAARYYEGSLHLRRAHLYAKDVRNDSERLMAEREFNEVLRWWRPLAEEGDPDSQYQLGMLYQEGDGVTKSPLNAIEWYYKAAQGYRKLGHRERALTALDHMRSLDASHPLTKKLYRVLVSEPSAP